MTGLPLTPLQAHALARCVADRPGETLTLVRLAGEGEQGPVRADFNLDELVVLENGSVVGVGVFA